MDIQLNISTTDGMFHYSFSNVELKSITDTDFRIRVHNRINDTQSFANMAPIFYNALLELHKKTINTIELIADDVIYNFTFNTNSLIGYEVKTYP